MKVQRRIGAHSPEALTTDERKALEKRIRERYPQAHRVKVVGTSDRPIVELWEADHKGHEQARVGSVAALLGADA